jgi:hypothetical protein
MVIAIVVGTERVSDAASIGRHAEMFVRAAGDPCRKALQSNRNWIFYPGQMVEGI